MNYDYFPERLQPCYLLRESDIPCVVWFEDAVRYYGVPVVLHALHVLVSDINEAAEVLVRKDWTLITQAPKKIGNAFVDTALHCLRPPNLKPVPPPSNMKPLGPTTTILLPATDWNWTISERREGSYSGDIARTFFPPLPQLLDAMIDSELDVPPSDAMLRLHISCMIGYLHDYVPAVKTREFVEELRYDNRQYHLDWLSGMSTATNSFIKHQRAIRDALRQGTYQLQECSASSDNEDLFIEKKSWPDLQRNIPHLKKSPGSRMKSRTCMIYQSMIQKTYDSNIYAFEMVDNVLVMMIRLEVNIRVLRINLVKTLHRSYYSSGK